jgi:hypothetical protein
MTPRDLPFNRHHLVAARRGVALFHGGIMAKRTTKKKAQKHESPCPLCGAEIETVWMKDGTVKAVEVDSVRAVFANHAMCDGREFHTWIPHHENCEKNR